VEFRDIGERTLVVDGTAVQPRIAKSHELLAYLLAQPERCATRERLLGALFESRRDDSTRAYLRQAIQWLRRVLPDGMLEVTRQTVALDPHATVRSASGQLEALLDEAARQQGDERLRTTTSALQAFEGEYLPGPRGQWADDRERELAHLVTDARHTAASLSFRIGHYDASLQHATNVLTTDPLRESTWRLLMRIAHARGDESGVLQAYAGCERALAQLNLSPAAATTRLLHRLRG
jgi:DNA-binding SARP family transcriptional activator